jgi:hypothetical protein
VGSLSYCLAKNGIRPVFGKTENERFLWGGAWQKFGVRLDKPKLGCVMVFTRSGRSHVAFYEGEEGSDYLIRGGNQSDAVTLMRMHRSKCTAAMWPATPAMPKPNRKSRMGRSSVSAPPLWQSRLRLTGSVRTPSSRPRQRSSQ